jgi:hypothetical protein
LSIALQIGLYDLDEASMVEARVVPAVNHFDGISRNRARLLSYSPVSEGARQSPHSAIENQLA